MNREEKIEETQLLLAETVTCPSCEDAKPGRCCTCGAKMSGATDDDVQPDPFCEEIHQDDQLHLQCDECLHASMMEI